MPRSLADATMATDINDLSLMFDGIVYADATAVPEVNDQIAMSIQIRSLSGEAREGVVRLLCELLDTSMVHADDGEWRVGGSNGATEISVTDTSSILIDTSEEGGGGLVVTDLLGAVDAGIFLKITPVNIAGFPKLYYLAFDDQ